MKKLLRLLVLVLSPVITVTESQGQVGIGINTPDASAALDLTSTSRGLLTPRMSAAQRLAIPAPAEGLIVHQTDSPVSGVGLGTLLGLYQFCGSQWVLLKADNLGNHTATKNLNMATYSLVGNGGSQGLQISNAGVITATALSGTGIRMVVTDASGNLGSQALPIASSGTTSTDAYGDGSAGSYTVTTDTDWTVDANLPNSGNLQFANFSVAAGVTLTVPSGTVIRCYGTAAVNGTVVVGNGALSTRGEINPGIARHGTGIKTTTTGSGDFAPMKGGIGLNSKILALAVPCNSLVGGGAGATITATIAGGTGAGGAGGGNVSVLARTGIYLSSNALIQANGSVIPATTYSVGGGAGGIVTLVTPGTLTLGGSIQANGSDGGIGYDSGGGGGGGGGGIVRLIAGAMSGASVASTTQVLGGAGGVNIPSSLMNTPGGLAGGACGGNGGNAGPYQGAGQSGSVGIIVNITTPNPQNIVH